jgi:hypothetical protein
MAHSNIVDVEKGKTVENIDPIGVRKSLLVSE